MNELPVSQQRLATASKIVVETCKELGEDEASCVMLEIGLAEHLYWQENNSFQLELTDLQMVALAAALAARLETYRQEQLENEKVETLEFV